MGLPGIGARSASKSRITGDAIELFPLLHLLGTPRRIECDLPNLQHGSLRPIYEEHPLSDSENKTLPHSLPISHAT